MARKRTVRKKPAQQPKKAKKPRNRREAIQAERGYKPLSTRQAVVALRNHVGAHLCAESAAEKILRRWWAAGLRADDRRPFLFPPASEIKAFRDRKGREVVVRSELESFLRVAGGWAYELGPCKQCRRFPFSSYALRVYGEHRRAWKERGKAVVACYCSAVLARLSPLEIPAADFARLPDRKRERAS